MQSVSPGAVKTEIFKGATKEMLEMFKSIPFLDPKDVADAVVYAISTPKHVQIQEIIIKPIGEQF